MDNFRGIFLKSLTASGDSFNIQNIVDFVMDVSVECSAYQNPIVIAVVSLSVSKPKLMSVGASPQTSLGTYNALPDTLAGFKGAALRHVGNGGRANIHLSVRGWYNAESTDKHCDEYVSNRIN